MLKVQTGDYLYYLASPYTGYTAMGGTPEAFRHVAAITGELIKRRVLVFSPICHCHPPTVEAQIREDDHGFWIDLDKKYIDRCDALLVAPMPGRLTSKGIQMEIDYCREQGKPVWYLSQCLNFKHTEPLEELFDEVA